MKKIPWQLLTLITIDVVWNLISSVAFVLRGIEVVWWALALSFLIFWGINVAVWYGLAGANKWALLIKGLLLALQAMEWPLGTVLALVQAGLLISADVRRYFGLKGGR